MPIGRYGNFYQRFDALALEFPPQQRPEVPMQNQSNAPVDQALPNENMPIGDPIDTIAQMLQLNLTAAASPEQRGQMVVQAVEALIAQCHDEAGMPEEVQDGEDQMYEDEEGGEEGDEGGEEYPAEDAESEGDEFEEPPEDEESETPPAQQKRPAIAASLSPRAFNMLKDARRTQILQLAQEGYISPFTAKQLEGRYCTDGSLSLSLEMNGPDQIDDFDFQIESFRQNGPVLSFQEKSGAQTKIGRLSPTGDIALSADEIKSETSNPLIASAIALRNKK